MSCWAWRDQRERPEGGFFSPRNGERATYPLKNPGRYAIICMAKREPIP